MRVAAVVLGLVAFANAITIPQTHASHEKRHVQTTKWVKRARVNSRALLPMRVGLVQSNLERGYDMLMDIAHPESPNFAKHYTSDEVVGMFAPAEERVDAVKAWLTGSGIDEHRITHSDNKGWLAFDATAEEAEALLHTEFHVYEHTATGYTNTACDEYHLPKDIQEHVDYITPGIKLMAPSKTPREKRAFSKSGGHPQPPKWRIPDPIKLLGELAACDKAITPICVAALYQIPPGNKANPNNAMGIFEEGDFYSQTDLDLFFANFTPYIPQGTGPKPAFIDGAQAPVTNVADAGGESDLDFELAYPILYPQGTVLYQTDDILYATNAPGHVTGGGFNTFLDAIDGSYCTYCAFGECGDDTANGNDPVYPDNSPGGYMGKTQCGVYKPTNVISISYGGQEADLPAYYQQRQCNEFMKLGLQGVSVFFASGDSGVAGRPGDGSANGCLGPNSDVFSPDWPASCPYVTAVGATKVYPGKSVLDPESAVVDPIGHPYRDAYSSGGGFSNIYAIPSYQKDAVTTYLGAHNPGYKSYTTSRAAGGIYNATGRGYPDVSANGDNIAVYNGGRFGLSGGTSASTPIFASIVNRINEERLAIGKKTVGFINPVLYSHPYVLNDITNGSNPGCNTIGFPAARGWDPVTGLGTPNFPRMLALWLLLP